MDLVIDICAGVAEDLPLVNFHAYIVFCLRSLASYWPTLIGSYNMHKFASCSVANLHAGMGAC